MPSLELAVQDDGRLLWGDGSQYPRDQAYAQMHDMGCTWLRLNVYSSYQHRLGWAPWDGAVDRALAKGFKVQMTITGQPRWDQQNHHGGVPFIDPTPSGFAEFVAEVVSRYRDRVRRFSLWNEPNHPAFLQVSSGNSADLYGKLYRAGYSALRGIDKDATVLFAELAGGVGSQAFLARAVKGGGLFASGMAIHPYQYLTNPSQPASGDNYQWGNIPKLKFHLIQFAKSRLLMTRDYKPLPIYVTEFGYFREGEKRGIPEGRRVMYARATIEQARKWGLRQYLWYHLLDAPGASWNSGIIGIDGTMSPTALEIKRNFNP